jgi:hypothetical protein
VIPTTGQRPEIIAANNNARRPATVRAIVRGALIPVFIPATVTFWKKYFDCPQPKKRHHRTPHLDGEPNQEKL